MKFYLIALFLLFGTLVSAEELQRGSFLIDAQNIHVVSSFDEVTYLTTYSSTGDLVWETAFNSEIVSWEAEDGKVYVFSKARNRLAYYLTCVDAQEGKLLWERVIVAPNNGKSE